MRTLLFVLCLLSFAASAEHLASMPNRAGGEIILTDTSLTRCGEIQRAVLSTTARGNMQVGCWFPDGGYVIVTWADGETSMYPLKAFTLLTQWDEETQTWEDVR